MPREVDTSLGATDRLRCLHRQRSPARKGPRVTRDKIGNDPSGYRDHHRRFALRAPTGSGLLGWAGGNLGPCFFRIAPRIAPRIEPGQFERGNPHHLPPRGKPVGDWCNGRRGSGARKARPSHLRPRLRDTHASTLTRKRQSRADPIRIDARRPRGLAYGGDHARRANSGNPVSPGP